MTRRKIRESWERSELGVTTQFELRSELDETGIPQLDFPNPFNIAELLIDRHLREGRGHKVGVRTLERDIRYAGLIASVNRFGNTLTKIGLRPGDRLAM